MLYRVFPQFPGAGLHDPGGPLFVARRVQGRGRHDSPADYGAIYGSRSPASAVAERLRGFFGQALTDADLLRPNGRLALASIDDADVGALVDLDDPRVLEERGLRPSRVATGERATTQDIARSIFRDGRSGLEWWSTVEASWINVTLFAERAGDKLSLGADSEVLTVEHPAVEGAARVLRIRLP